MKIFLKRFVAVALGLGISLAGVTPALASTFTWSADTIVNLSSPQSINMTIASGSHADTFVVNAGSITVAIANGDSFTISSGDRQLQVTGRSTDVVAESCASSVSTLAITGGAGAETLTITPNIVACNESSGGSGGGGGGSSTPKPPTTPPVVMPPVGTAHSAGSVVKTSDGTVWFITTDGHRRAFTSGGAFLSYGFLSFAMVVDANSGDTALPAGSFIPPQDGKIICSDRDDSYAKKGTCYLITAGKRAAFTSSAVFTGQGFSFARSTKGDVSFMPTDTNISSATAAHRAGVLVNNKGTIQLVGTSSLMGIPSASVFQTWGYSFADTVTANAADKLMTQSGVMMSRVTGQLSPQ
jgi:hypothetical protein